MLIHANREVVIYPVGLTIFFQAKANTAFWLGEVGDWSTYSGVFLHFFHLKFIFGLVEQGVFIRFLRAKKINNKSTSVHVEPPPTTKPNGSPRFTYFWQPAVGLGGTVATEAFPGQDQNVDGRQETQSAESDGAALCNVRTNALLALCVEVRWTVRAKHNFFKCQLTIKRGPFTCGLALKAVGFVFVRLLAKRAEKPNSRLKTFRPIRMMICATLPQNWDFASICDTYTYIHNKGSAIS